MRTSVELIAVTFGTTGLSGDLTPSIKFIFYILINSPLLNIIKCRLNVGWNRRDNMFSNLETHSVQDVNSMDFSKFTVLVTDSPQS